VGGPRNNWLDFAGDPGSYVLESGIRIHRSRNFFKGFLTKFLEEWGDPDHEPNPEILKVFYLPLQIGVSGLVVECRTRNFQVAGSYLTVGHLQATLSKLLTYGVLRTQPPTLRGTGNE